VTVRFGGAHMETLQTGRLLWRRLVGLFMAGVLSAMWVNCSAETAFAQGNTKETITDKRPLVLDETFSGIVEASVGDRIEIRLKALLGAGYSWSVEDFKDESAKYIGTRIEAADGRQAGVGGQINWQVFSFQATKVGAAEFRFIYHRPWLRPSESDRRLSFNVSIQDRK
jgi:predicted secreted protein